jgi:hypothetical protein
MSVSTLASTKDKPQNKVVKNKIALLLAQEKTVARKFSDHECQPRTSASALFVFGVQKEPRA